MHSLGLRIPLINLNRSYVKDAKRKHPSRPVHRKFLKHFLDLICRYQTSYNCINILKSLVFFGNMTFQVNTKISRLKLFSIYCKKELTMFTRDYQFPILICASMQTTLSGSSICKQSLKNCLSSMAEIQQFWIH